MEFLKEEVITALGLTPEQVAGIKTPYDTHLAELKQGWDNTANENAEKIIGGAIESTAKKFNIELPREQGEKNADYLIRLNEKVVATQQANVTVLENDYKQKLKDFDGGKGQKEELERVKGELDKAQLKLVDYDDLVTKAGRVDEIETKYNSLRDKQFFQDEKPKFPETVNEYEAEAKWGNFLKAFDEKWTKEFGEKGESIAVSRENPHLKKPLSELISADAELSKLMEGRKQTGTGATGASKELGATGIILPDNPDSTDISKAINDYLDKNCKHPRTSKERTKEFTELNTKVYEELKK